MPREPKTFVLEGDVKHSFVWVKHVRGITKFGEKREERERERERERKVDV